VIFSAYLALNISLWLEIHSFETFLAEISHLTTMDLDFSPTLKRKRL